MSNLTAGQFELVYNAFSFGFATLAAATIFFWFGRGEVASRYKTAITITSLVTFIAAYHYLRIFQSWNEAYTFVDGAIKATGVPFNDAYRYVDWLLTVPLLMIELILVMGLNKKDTVSKATRLGILAAVMIALGYPGEVASSVDQRWLFGILSMIPFLWIVYELTVGLAKSISDQPQAARGLIGGARSLTVVAWLFYPAVYFAGAVGMGGATSEVVVQTGYTIADLVAKVVFGLLIYAIARRKSEAETQGAG